jgi:hypothetical protein
VSALLQQDGHLVEMVGDGEAALGKARTGSFDIILLDVHMPRLDGIEAASRIRALPGGKGDVPLVALTGSAMPGDRQRLLAAGLDEVLVKPVPAATLLETVARLGRGGRPAQAALDEATLAALETSLGAGTLRELVDACLAELGGRLPALEGAADAAALAAEAHAMAGAAAGHGLGALASILRRIEAAARQGQAEDAQGLVAQVGPALQRAAQALAARHTSVALA